MPESIKVVTTNRKARYNFQIGDTFEAGMVLLGTEVKSLREGKVNLADAYCRVERGEVFLHNAHINPYDLGTHFNHEPLRTRKLLLNRREIKKLEKDSLLKGATIVPLRIYFKDGRAKIEIGLGRGKKQYDKRADIAERDSRRRLDRLKGN
jgi:SsrA-binding protein